MFWYRSDEVAAIFLVFGGIAGGDDFLSLRAENFEHGFFVIFSARRLPRAWLAASALG